jgi:HSP20 family protein
MSDLRKGQWPNLFEIYFGKPEKILDVFTTSLKGVEPKVDILQTDTDVVVKANVPGMTKEDLSIVLKDGMITISGEFKDETEGKTSTYFHSERHFGSFNRTIPLPSEVMAGKAVAKFENGVLTITIPKTVKVDEGIKIEIN